MRYRIGSSRLGALAFVLAVGLSAPSAVEAQTKTACLVAAPFTPASGAAAGVPMWGYAEAPLDGGACAWGAAGAPTSPGPRITVAPGENLTINLRNQLPVATSIVIPGLPSAGAPARLGGRAVSFTTEVAAGADGSYSWPSVRPGSYLYQSGSHVQVQVQMGLYGAMTKDFAAGEAYDGQPYASEVVLFYSEVDPVLHQAVSTGAYGGLLPVPAPGGGFATTPTMTSTFDYKPRYFLVNGDAFSSSALPIAAGSPASATLIRFLNAGLRTHVPTLQNGDFELLAEDAYPYGYARRQVQLSLYAGKTMDVLWTPAAAGTYAVYDRTPHLTTNGGGPGGMIVKLAVGGALSASDDVYGARNDAPLVIAAPGVMANDSTITIATLASGPSVGSLTLNSDGSFTYTAPAGYEGPVTFTYQQPGSNVATVTITVSANAAPVASSAVVTTNEDAAVAITLPATDVNSDPLTYAYTQPAHGQVTGVGPNVVYTPAANYNGPDSFTFTANDGTLGSAVGTVSITVASVNDGPAATSATVGTAEDTSITITLTGVDPDGDPLTFAIASPPANGTLSGFNPATGVVIYTPRLDYNGTDSFRFAVTDPGGAISPVATISIPVSPVLDNPIAAADTFNTKYNVTTTLNVLVNDKDPDGTPLTINNSPVAFPKCFDSTTGQPTSEGAVCAAATGVDKVTINSSSNRLTFVPNATVRRNRTIAFTYQARDGGGALSAAAGVTLNVSR